MVLSREIQYAQQSQVERLIAAGRIVLSLFSLLAIRLDPTDPVDYARMIFHILSAYTAYSLVLGAVTFLYGHIIRNSLKVLSHCVDMAIFALLIFFSNGPASPFFVYFIFLLVCATLRWQRRGTIWTTIAITSIVLVLAWYPSDFLHDKDFELNRFIIRIVYLAVVATLLGYLGTHEQSLRKTLVRLAAWPHPVSSGPEELPREILGHAADILESGRIVLLWEEEEEPWLHLAYWTPSEYRCTREPPGSLGNVVSDQLAGADFFCRNALQEGTISVRDRTVGCRLWHGMPLNRELRERFDIRSVLALKIHGETSDGYLLALDKQAMTTDDLMLGELVTQEIMSRLEFYFMQERLRRAAVLNERLRLARDLHDGILQSLTGIALQLETARRLMEADPAPALQQIREVQQLIVAEQQDLRTHINELRPLMPDRPLENFRLSPRLEELVERIRRQWDLKAEIAINPSSYRLSGSMAREIYFVVHEALINAARHAGASALRAEVIFEENRVDITVCDNGHGFPFHGCYDHATLLAMRRGPVTLRERIIALGGTLSIDSRDSGARLDIALPLMEFRG